MNSVVAAQLMPRSIRRLLLRAWGVDLQTKALHPGYTFSSPNVAIGAGTTVNVFAFFEAGARITIGERCGFGPHCSFLTSTHEVGGPARRMGEDITLPVTIGDGAWLGASVVVQPGVTIGAGCIIATGAVVTSDCEPNGFYAGVPARRIRDLDT